LRVRVVSGHEEVGPGAVFGYEWTLEGKRVFTQFEWNFQGELSCRLSRFTLELPQGWTAEGVLFRHPPVAPRVEQSRYTWELRDLPGLADEPACPPPTSLSARLAAGCWPATGARNGDLVHFSTWAEVARWLDLLTEPMHLPSPEIATRANDAVRGAQSELDTIRSVGRAVQHLRYASIPLGLYRGGGYCPVPAATTLARGYGDCKDKANLMRSMLATMGIEAHLVAVFSGDPHYVEEGWPSPSSFNHCVIAVRPRGGMPLSSTVHDSVLGTLTLFDPTDPFTALGDLPETIQGSLALVIAPGTRSPMRIPRLSENGALERRVTLELRADGAVAGRLEDRASGPMAGPLRQLVHHRGIHERRAAFERWFSRAASGARIGALEADDDTLRDRVRTLVEFELARYGQLMRRDLLMFRPFLFPSGDRSLLALAEPRRYPIVLSTQALRETVVVHLPAGFRVDELPEPITLDAPFGRYTSSVRRSGPDLELTRTLDVRAGRLPPDRLPAVLDFHRAIRRHEETPVVLERQ